MGKMIKDTSEDKSEAKDKKWFIHDCFFKSVFSDLKLVRALLKLAFSPQRLSKYNLDEIEIVREIFGNKRADLVVLVPSRTDPGTSADWLIIIEHKSYYEKGIYGQALNYQIEARNYYFNKLGHALKISSLIFYHGRQVNWEESLQADDFREGYGGVSEEERQEMVNYKPHFIDIHDEKVQRASADRDCEIRCLIKLITQARNIRGRSVEEIRVMIREDFSYIMKDWEVSRAHEIIRQIMTYIKALGDYTEEEMQELKKLLAADELLPEGFMTFEEYYRKKWLEEGREEGRVEGREEGRVEGREEGMEKGRVEGQREIIFSMLKRRLEISKISETTGLSEQEIQNLLCYR